MKSTKVLRLEWFLRSFVAIVCIGAMCLPAVAGTKLPSMITKADHADIRAFVINKDVLQRLHAVITEGRKLQVKRVRVNVSSAHSLAGLAEHMVASNSQLGPLLAKHGFTPRQFLVADLAVVATVKSARQRSAAPQTKAKKRVNTKAGHAQSRAKWWWVDDVNQTNLDFYKTHKAVMDQVADASLAPRK